MQTATTLATAVTVAPAYTGPLGRHIAHQQAQAQQQATINAMRANIAAMMIEPLFDAGEQLRCNDSIYQTECVAKLQTWFRNVYRVYQERESSLYMAFNDGTCAFLPVTA